MRRCAGYAEVFQLGLGKSGTTTIKKYFADSYDYNVTCGEELTALIQAEVDARRPLLDAARTRCPHFYISELMRVYWPAESIALQLTDLHALRVGAPRALFVHCARNTTKWVSSVARWNSLQTRLAQRDLPGLPLGTGQRLKELADWYEGTNAQIAFHFAHRSNYVRVDVDSLASLRALERFCGRYPQDYHWVPQNVNRRAATSPPNDIRAAKSALRAAGAPLTVPGQRLGGTVRAVRATVRARNDAQARSEPRRPLRLAAAPPRPARLHLRVAGAAWH
jgi:hypothetical protein